MSSTAPASSPKVKVFDYVVIGGGSGGIASARRAASYGANVAIIEGSRWGGTCVNVGCVPKKVMFNAAWTMEFLHSAHHFGIYQKSGDAADLPKASDTKKKIEAQFDWPELKRKRDAYVAKLNKIYTSNLEKSGVTRFEGLASFIDANTLRVETSKTIGVVDEASAMNGGEVEVRGKKILIATGGYPASAGLEGEELTITSDSFFELKTQPKRVAVIGAGYIAVELAGIFQALGTETELFTRGEVALRKFDEMLRTQLKKEMDRSGMKHHPNSTPVKFTRDASSGLLSVHLEGGKVFDGYDCILRATGRSPQVDSLSLPRAGVKQIKGGYIAVDEYSSTSQENIFALGDVCGKVELTPMAIAAGRKLADRLFAGHSNAKASYDMVPTVIFSHPTIGTCGLTEEEASNMYGKDKLNVYKSSFVNLFYGPWEVDPEEKPKTLMKVICLKEENNRIVGLHIIGMGADEMLQGFGVALKMGATKEDLDNCIAIHPTASEELVTLPPWSPPPSNL